MNVDFSSLETEELLQLFHQVNAELVKEFSNHGPWREQEPRIRKLSMIAEELRNRKAQKTFSLHSETEKEAQLDSIRKSCFHP